MTRELTTEQVQVLKDLKSQIYSAQRYTEARNPHDLFIDAENIIGNLAYVSGIMLEFESQYRKLKVAEIEKGNSVAKAEAVAKASDEYVTWKKIESLHNLAIEQIRLIKKFQHVIETEHQNS